VADWSTGTVDARHGNPRFVDLTADKPFYGGSDVPRITARFALVKYAYERARRPRSAGDSTTATTA